MGSLLSFVLLHGFMPLSVGLCLWLLPVLGFPLSALLIVFVASSFPHGACGGSFLGLHSPFRVSLFLFPVILSSMVPSRWVMPSLVAILSALLFSHCGSAQSFWLCFGLFLSFSFSRTPSSSPSVHIAFPFHVFGVLQCHLPLSLPSFLVFCGVFFLS